MTSANVPETKAVDRNPQQDRLHQLARMAADPVRHMTRLRSVQLNPVLPRPRDESHRIEPSLRIPMSDGTEVEVDVAERALRDVWPIPATEDREGYFGDNHVGYWLSGLIDFEKVRHAWDLRKGGGPTHLLDLGCASGRILRHAFACDDDWKVTGCDIDQRNIDWGKRHLARGMHVFQNTVFPHLPLPDASVDVITAFSVFTHIDKLEDAWLMELRRVLKKGGMAYITAHTERVWRRVNDSPFRIEGMLRCRSEWSLPEGLQIHRDMFATAMPHDYIVMRWEEAGAYVAQTFHSTRHIEQEWGRILEVEEIHDAYHSGYQDVVILRR